MTVEEIVGHLKVHEGTKKKNANDSSFSGWSGRGSHNKEKGGRGRDRERGGRGGLDNTLQTHENVNPRKDKSMIKGYSSIKYWHYAAECCNKER